MRLKETKLADYLVHIDGQLFWSAGCNKGKEAGSLRPDGYRIINKFRVQYYAHRIIWCLHRGDIPDGMHVDHINGNRSDNRIENLRMVQIAENNKNVSVRGSSRTGVHGIQLNDKHGNFTARIRIHRSLITLGTFSCLLDAVAARKSAELKFGFHPNHGRQSKAAQPKH
jgi:hypothetical protein